MVRELAKHYDLVVIGAGPGGYVAAIRAAQVGMKVAVVEKEKIGGVCLHKGCIPSKTLLQSAELFAAMQNSVEMGVVAEQVHIDWQQIQARKQRIVAQLQQGIEQLFAQQGIDVYAGTGRILGPSIFSPLPGTVSVTSAQNEEAQMLVPQQLILATGSRPRPLPGLPFDGEKILSSDQALEMASLPRSMLIIGGGVIGVEWASMLSDFGVEVTIVEAAERLLPGEDERISREMERSLSSRGVQVFTTAQLDLEQVNQQGTNLRVVVKYKQEDYTLEIEKMLVSIGRQPNVEGIGLQNTDIQLSNGFIEVNEWMQTQEEHIYAIGDVVGGYQLAHVASHEGLLAIDHIQQKRKMIETPTVEPINPSLIPRCTYSRPEVGSIGLTEAEAREQGYAVNVTTHPWKLVPKAMVMGESEGVVKLVVDEESDDILGIHIIGTRATELISMAGLTQFLDASAWEMGQAVYAHPTLAEVLQEVSLAVEKRAIHKA